jgi:hypothetical protein
LVGGCVSETNKKYNSGVVYERIGVVLIIMPRIIGRQCDEAQR